MRQEKQPCSLAVAGGAGIVGAVRKRRRLGLQDQERFTACLAATLLGMLLVFGVGCIRTDVPVATESANPEAVFQDTATLSSVSEPATVVAEVTELNPEPVSPTVAANPALAEENVIPSPTALPPIPRTHMVQAGDTLLGIALAFDVPLAALQLENDLGAATTIRVGQVLDIPPATAWTTASPFWVVHEIAPGETLSALAARYGLGLDALVAANPGLNADRLAVGQALVLPLRGPADVVAMVNAPTPTSPVPPTQTPFSLPTPTATVVSELDAADQLVEPAAPAVPTAISPLPEDPTPPAPDAGVPAEVAALPAEVYRLLNAERAAHDLPPLAWNETLARAAQRHANDCQARGWCSHTGSDGSSYRERIIREGYDPVRWSECWAWYGSAERAVAMWMNETPPNDPHRRTILAPHLTEVGVGVVPGKGFGYYFIANFGTPRQ